MMRFLPHVSLTLAIVSSSLAFAASDSAAVQAVNRDAQTLADFQTRVRSYLQLRQKLAAGIPALPDKASPEQIEAYQNGLGKAVMTARKGARKGDLFGADMIALVRRLLGPIFKGPDGAAIKNAILEEPQPAVPTINTRYPEDAPVSTMPAEILKVLPKIDESLEFRFVGRHLILLDAPSHLILDIVDNVMPS